MKQKIEIWAPYPYQVVAFREPKEGEKVLGNCGQVLTAGWDCNIQVPILGDLGISWEDQIIAGLKGHFKDSGDEDWTASEYQLKQQNSEVVESITFDQEIDTDKKFWYVDKDDDPWDEFRPTQIRSLVEVEVPKGYNAVRYGETFDTREYVIANGNPPVAGPCGLTGLVVEVAGCSPTVEDMGKKCRFRYSWEDTWTEGRLNVIQIGEDGSLFYNPFENDWAYDICEVLE